MLWTQASFNLNHHLYSCSTPASFFKPHIDDITQNDVFAMAKVEVLTIVSLAKLVNVDALYLLGYSWLFGMC